MLKHGNFGVFDIGYLREKYPFDKIVALNTDCYFYKTFKEKDYEMLMEEAKEAIIHMYWFDISKVSIGATKICSWCHAKKVKVNDWATHMQKIHPKIDSSEALRQVFVGYKVQSCLYQILTRRLKKNWKQLAILEGGCYQCLNTNIMFDRTENKVPKRCVRMDTPKSRMVDFSFWGINTSKMKKIVRFGDFDSNDYLLGGIVEWPIKKLEQ